MSAALRPLTQGDRLDVLDVGDFVLTRTRHRGELRLPAHAHAESTITLVLRGGFVESFGRTRVDCRAGSALVKPAGVEHANRYGAEGCDSLLIEVRPAQERSLLSRAVAGVRHLPSELSRGIVRRIQRESSVDDPASRLLLDGLIRQLLGLGWRRSEESSGSPPWLARLIERLHDTYRDAPRVAELAAEAGVHPDHLTRVFKAHTGSLVGEFVRELQIEGAARDLRGSDLPIAVIAARQGFSDQSHLTRWFRRHTGTTPGRYRSLSRD